ncbi:MAG: hypothetical protein JJU12_00720 [Chlamydiales bacterium]|nr:hypothetical protein [Chlamydiales bacterium]
MEEISEIQKTKALGQIHKKEGVGRPQVVDTLSISSESEKKAIWVEMLKEMPDLRPEKIEEALNSTSPSSQKLAYIILNQQL